MVLRGEVKSMNLKFILGIFILIAGLGLGWYVLGDGYTLPGLIKKEPVTVPSPLFAPRETTTSSTITPYPEMGIGTEKGGLTATEKVTYTDNGYVPDVLTVKAGTTVSFVNQSAGGMWTASDMHPTHQLLPGFDELASVPKGGSYEYTFTKVGTWKYHNHVNATDGGTVIVTE